MAVQELTNEEDSLVFFYYKFPSIFQTRVMKEQGKAWLCFGPGLFVNSCYPEPLALCKWQ
jgi:hypothetical protein